MDIEAILKEQQSDYWSWVRQSPSIEREKDSLLKEYLPAQQIKIISGIRRCGKSHFSIRNLPREKTVYVNFDDERLFQMKANDLARIYEAGLKIVPEVKFWVFDEIQNVDGWELFVNRLQKKNVNLIVTGSNSKMLSRELASNLTGRTLTIEMMPFSFREYLLFQNFDPQIPSTSEGRAQCKLHFDQYLLHGGFPETINNPLAADYLRELFDRIITRDVSQRYQIRDLRALKSLAILVLNYSAQELSFSKLQKNFSSMSINTLRKYIGYIQETFLSLEVESYSPKIRERLTKVRKTYAIDTGMFNGLSDNPQRTLGRQLENLVFLELKRRKKEISFFKSQKCEVDFVCTQNRKPREIIQVCWDISDQGTRAREFKGLSLASAELGKTRQLILTYDNEEVSADVSVLPVWKWLLLDQNQN
jgi:predicted AAA+ superfamily ATPase